MRWFAYLGLTATVLVSTSQATIPVSVTGEFGFPGNVNPLIYPAGTVTASERASHVAGLITQANNDPDIIRRIEYAEADSSALGNPTADPELTCNEAQYTEGVAVFRETMYLADYARTKVVAKDQMSV